MFQENTAAMMKNSVRARRLAAGIVSVSKEELSISRLEQKYLERPSWRRQVLDEQSCDEIRLETCDILMELVREKPLHAIAASATHPEAFAIAHYVKNLSAKNVLSIEADDLFDLIMTIPSAAGGQSPVASRFWFSQALVEQQVVIGRNTNQNIKPSMSTPSAREILSLIEELTGISPESIISNERGRTISDARFKAIYTMRQVSAMSLSQIGTVMGGRDHTTILNGIVQIRRRMSTDIGRRPVMMRLCNLADTIGATRNYNFLRSQAAVTKQDAKKAQRRIRIPRSPALGSAHA